MGTERVHVDGFAEIDRLLKDLPAKLEASVVRGGIRAGAKVFADAARERVPVDTGALRDSIRVRTRSRRGRVSATVVAGDKDAWYPHLIEFGTAGFYEGSGTTVGKPYEIKPQRRRSLFFAGLARELITHPGIAAQPYMRPALDLSKDEAIRAAAEYMRQRIPREIAKATR